MTHVPVLFQEVLDRCAEIPFDGAWFVDGTFGRGGHSRKILDTFPESKILALDKDQEAVEHALQDFGPYIRSGRFEIQNRDFVDFKSALNGRPFIGALLDLGVSSPQLDQGARGFSFYHDGPLDMRMDQSQSLSAADIVNTWSEQDLCEIFRTYGEVRRPERVAKAIVHDRKTKSFTSTLQLAGLFERLDGWRKKGHHPATNYFMALRIAVNDELGVIQKVLPLMAECLLDRGRLLVITFHSLEDRIVKYTFRDLEKKELGFQVNKKVIVPAWSEQKINPRSRSAKLRVWQKGERP